MDPFRFLVDIVITIIKIIIIIIVTRNENQSV